MNLKTFLRPGGGTPPRETLDLAAKLLAGQDPEGKEFDKAIRRRLGRFHDAVYSLHKSEVRRETWARRKDFFLGLPGIRRLVKRSGM